MKKGAETAANMTGVNDLLASAESDFVMFTTTVCPYCRRAKNMLDAKGLSVEEHDLSETPDLRIEVVTMTGHRTVPAIWDVRGDDPTFVGGSDDLLEYL